MRQRLFSSFTKFSLCLTVSVISYVHHQNHHSDSFAHGHRTRAHGSSQENVLKEKRRRIVLLLLLTTRNLLFLLEPLWFHSTGPRAHYSHVIGNVYILDCRFSVLSLQKNQRLIYTKIYGKENYLDMHVHWVGCRRPHTSTLERQHFFAFRYPLRRYRRISRYLGWVQDNTLNQKSFCYFLQALTIIVLDIQLFHINTIETTDIKSECRRTIRCHAPRKGLHAARLTK